MLPPTYPSCIAAITPMSRVIIHNAPASPATPMPANPTTARRAAGTREHGPGGRPDIATALRHAPPDLWRDVKKLALAAVLALFAASAHAQPFSENGLAEIAATFTLYRQNCDGALSTAKQANIESATRELAEKVKAAAAAAMLDQFERFGRADWCDSVRKAYGPSPSELLSIKVLKTESGPYTHLLLSVENASDQTFRATKWSCVFLDGEEPVHEEENLVRNVPARGRAVRRIIQNYGGPFDKIECRFMAAQEERP
jgi:hypothetical protein